MNVEVVYATSDAQTIVEIELAEHATVSDALNASGLYKQYPSIEAGVTPVGIYCLLYTSPSPRDLSTSRMPSSA